MYDILKKRLEALEEKLKRREYLSPVGVAEEYPFTSPGAVRTLASRRRIPFRKIGGKLIFLRRELDAWIEDSPGLTINEYQRKERQK